MRSMLEELWYGNICLSSGCREGTKEVKELMGSSRLRARACDRTKQGVWRAECIEARQTTMRLRRRVAITRR